MGSGSPTESRIAPRVLGCAVRLAESLGQTGPLLAALDKELAFASERASQLEALYEVIVKRVESLSGHVPFLERSHAEAKAAHEDSQAEIRRLKQALKAAEQQNRQHERQKA